MLHHYIRSIFDHSKDTFGLAHASPILPKYHKGRLVWGDLSLARKAQTVIHSTINMLQYKRSIHNITQSRMSWE